MVKEMDGSAWIHSYLVLSVCLYLLLLLSSNLWPSVFINTLHSPRVPFLSNSSSIFTLRHFFFSFSFCLSLLTVAIIKGCPVRYVAHGCYWCPFITHYRWVPVGVLTAHKPADTHKHIVHTQLHIHTSSVKMQGSTAWASRTVQDCIVAVSCERNVLRTHVR